MNLRSMRVFPVKHVFEQKRSAGPLKLFWFDKKKLKIIIKFLHTLYSHFFYKY